MVQLNVEASDDVCAPCRRRWRGNGSAPIAPTNTGGGSESTSPAACAAHRSTEALYHEWLVFSSATSGTLPPKQACGSIPTDKTYGYSML